MRNPGCTVNDLPAESKLQKFVASQESRGTLSAQLMNCLHVCATPALSVQTYLLRAVTCELHNFAVGPLHAKLRMLGAPDLICDLPGLEGDAQGVVKPGVGGTCSGGSAVSSLGCCMQRLTQTDACIVGISRVGHSMQEVRDGRWG